MKYTLKRPIKVGSIEVTELNFREEVVAGDMRGIAMRSPMHWDDILKLTARLCAQPDQVINAMSAADLPKVTELVSGFLASGLETGNSQSDS
jgi:hypothetical protein